MQGQWASPLPGSSVGDLLRRGRLARWPRWRRAWRASRLNEPWRVGPLVAMSEPAVAALVAVVVLLLALRAGVVLTPATFLVGSLALGAAGHLLGRLRAAQVFRWWARLAAELPFALTGAERMLRRPAGTAVGMEIHFESALPVETQVLRATLDAAAVPGAPVVLLRVDRGSATVTAFGPAWLAVWALKRLLLTLVALDDAYPIVRVDLRAGRGR